MRLIQKRRKHWRGKREKTEFLQLCPWVRVGGCHQVLGRRGWLAQGAWTVVYNKRRAGTVGEHRCRGVGSCGWWWEVTSGCFHFFTVMGTVTIWDWRWVKKYWGLGREAKVCNSSLEKERVNALGHFAMIAWWLEGLPEITVTYLGFLQGCSIMWYSHRVDKELDLANWSSKGRERQQSQSACRGEMVILDQGF